MAKETMKRYRLVAMTPTVIEFDALNRKQVDDMLKWFVINYPKIRYPLSHTKEDTALAGLKALSLEDLGPTPNGPDFTNKPRLVSIEGPESMAQTDTEAVDSTNSPGPEVAHRVTN